MSAAVAHAPGLDVALLSRRELAIYLGRSLASIDRDASAARLPSPVRIGSRTVKYRRAEIDAWLAAGCPSREEWEKQQATGGKGRR